MIKYRTGIVKMLFPHFVEPSKFNSNDIPKYDCQILFDKSSEEIEILKKLLDIDNLEFNPLRDGDMKSEDLEIKGKNGSDYQGKYYMKVFSLYPPSLYTSTGEQWLGDERSLHRREAKMTIAFKSKENSVSCYLKSITIM